MSMLEMPSGVLVEALNVNIDRLPAPNWMGVRDESTPDGRPDRVAASPFRTE
jgi:hypothetical protein